MFKSADAEPETESLDPTKVEFRSALAQDAQAISELIRSLSSHALVSPDGVGAEHFLASTSEIAEAGYIADTRYRYSVVTSGTGLAGFIAVRDNSHLFHLFVAPRFQRRGLATRLWQAARSAAVANGNAEGFTVNSTVLAVPVYECFGFVRTGPECERHGICFVPMYLAPNSARR